jgi:O-antigen ligase/tetratricopeptide (TPR) repeat protein
VQRKRSRPPAAASARAVAPAQRDAPSWELLGYSALIFLVALLFSTRLEVQFTLPKLLAIRLLAPVLGLLWLARFLSGGTSPLPRAIAISAGLVVATWVVSTIDAVHVATALNGAHGRYNGLWNHLIFLAVSVMIATSRLGRAEIERVANALVIALSIAALYAVVQYAGLDPITWPGLRSAATIGNPVVLGAALGLAMPFALVSALLANRPGRRWGWGVLLVVMSAGLLSTLSRGPLLSSAGALALVSLLIGWEYRHRINRMVVVAAAIVLAVMLGLGYAQLMQTRQTLPGAAEGEATNTLADRFNTYAAALQIVRESPLTGVGLENFSVVYPRYRSEASEQLTPDVLPTMVHNGYLQAAATTGVPGLIAYLLLIGAVLSVLVQAWRHRADRRERWLIAACIGSIAGYLVQDLTGWLEISLSAFFWIVVGLGLALASLGTKGEPIPPPARLAVAGAAGAAIVGALVLFAQTAMIARADLLMRFVRSLSVQEHWRQIESTTAMVSGLPGADARYLDQAGVRYAERYGILGEPSVRAEAEKLFERSRRADPFNPYVPLHWLSLEASAVQKKAAAGSGVEGLVSEVLALDRNNATVHEMVARYRLAQERWDDAFAALRRAQALRPTQGRYVVIEGDVRRGLGDRAGMMDAYRRALVMLEPDREEYADASRKLAAALIELGRSREALDVIAPASARRPQDGLLHTLEGLARLGTQQPDLAVAAFQRALAIDPQNTPAKQGLSEAQRAAGAPRQ